MSAPAVGDRPLRVALATPSTWPEVRRGAERMFRDLAGGLVARGDSVRLLTSHAGRPARAAEGGVEVVRAWRPPDGRLMRRGFESGLTHLPATWLALRRGADDVVHASHAPDAVVAARWSRATGRPAVFSHMGIPDRAWLVERRLRLDLVLEAVRGCAAVTALSRHAAQAFARDLGVEARVIAPGVDVEAFSPGGQRHKDPTIVCVAPLDVPEKRVELLIEALPRVRRAHPRARLVLQRPRDPGLAAGALARDGVELIDPDPALLVCAYRSAWVSALPSRSEAFGLVLAESLACGTPAVGANRGGIPEVLDRPQVGRLFDGDDPAAVADALLEGLELAQEPSTAAACRARACELSVDRCTDEFAALYRELLAAA